MQKLVLDLIEAVEIMIKEFETDCDNKPPGFDTDCDCEPHIKARNAVEYAKVLIEKIKRS